MTLILFDSNFTTISLLGVAATASQGNVTAEGDLGVIGASAIVTTSGLSVFTIDSSGTIGGYAAIGSIGGLSSETDAIFVAANASGQIHALSDSASRPFAGTLATADVGAITTNTANVSALSGVGASTAVALMTSAIDIQATGLAASAMSGNYPTLVLPQLTGAQATGTNAALATQSTPALAGVQASGDVGLSGINVAPPLLIGVAATCACNTLTIAIYETGSPAIAVGQIASLTPQNIGTTFSASAATSCGVFAPVVQQSQQANLSGTSGSGLSGLAAIIGGQRMLLGTLSVATPGHLDPDISLLNGVSSRGDPGQIRFRTAQRKKAGGRGATRSGKSPMARQRLPPRDPSETAAQMLARWKFLASELHQPIQPDSISNPSPKGSETVFDGDSTVRDWHRQIAIEDQIFVGGDENTSADDQIEAEDIALLLG